VAPQFFVFLQMEFPWLLGPADGRYLLRSALDGEPQKVVVLDTLSTGRLGSREASAPGKPSRLARLTARSGEDRPASADPAEVRTNRTTVIDPVPLSAESQAQAWLRDIDSQHELQATAEVVNRVLHFHRIASADPYVHEVSPAQAIVLRAGWGEGEQVADGRWLHAQELHWTPPGRSSRGRFRGGRTHTSALRPQERLAELMGARGETLLCEELALRARLDLDHDRPRHAAIELDRAMAAAVLELRTPDRQDLTVRVAELEQLHPQVSEQAHAALPDTEVGPDVDVLEHALGRLEAALRARSAGGFSR
jgi:hypothetical protein